jgi:hypothetical protein
MDNGGTNATPFEPWAITYMLCQHMKFLLVLITWLECHIILVKSNPSQAPHKIHSSCFQQYGNKTMILKLSFDMVQVSWLRWVIPNYYENALHNLQRILSI